MSHSLRRQWVFPSTSSISSIPYFQKEEEEEEDEEKKQTFSFGQGGSFSPLSVFQVSSALLNILRCSYKHYIAFSDAKFVWFSGSVEVFLTHFMFVVKTSRGTNYSR